MNGHVRSGNESRRAQLLKGLAELALLSMLDDGPQYGLGLLERMRSDAGLDLAEGTIYPLLHRLKKAGLTLSEWRLEQGETRPRKYYALTPSGRDELSLQLSEWLRLSGALNVFLGRPTCR